MPHILVIDDDVSIGNLMEEVLAREGYRVTRAYSGTEALLALPAAKPDLVLLDLMLPGLSGEAILPALRGIPVIVVSAKTDVDDKVRVLLDGAADYLTKPFHTQELLARVAVRLRGDAARKSGVLEFEELSLDPDTRSVCAAGKPVKLTRTEFAILHLLMRNPEQVVAKSVMLDRLSLDTPDCMESSLKVHVSHLRGKLREACGRDCIEAVWGIGFKLKKRSLTES